MRFIKTFICFVLFLTLFVVAKAPIDAHAKYHVYYQRSSALHKGSLRNLNNSKVHYVKVPKSTIMSPTLGSNTKLLRNEVKKSNSTPVTFCRCLVKMANVGATHNRLP